VVRNDINTVTIQSCQNTENNSIERYQLKHSNNDFNAYEQLSTQKHKKYEKTKQHDISKKQSHNKE
jgi:hypothetical protein